jgi:hypothetical protein
MNKETSEKLAELEHVQWAHWTQHMLDGAKIVEVKDD